MSCAQQTNFGFGPGFPMAVMPASRAGVIGQAGGGGGAQRPETIDVIAGQIRPALVSC